MTNASMRPAQKARGNNTLELKRVFGKGGFNEARAKSTG